MKALTLTQPWATLVAIGAKRIETRSWRTSYRGPLAIHAAKEFPKAARKFSTQFVCYDAMRRSARLELREKGWPPYPLGYVMATCRLVNVLPVEVVDNGGNAFGVSLEPLDAREKAFGDYTPGRWAWILEGAKILETPLPAKGALSLWDWEPTADERTSLSNPHPASIQTKTE
jgi:hypothetical protein